MINPITQEEDSEMCTEKRQMNLLGVSVEWFMLQGKVGLLTLQGFFFMPICDKSILKMKTPLAVQPYFRRNIGVSMGVGGEERYRWRRMEE